MTGLTPEAKRELLTRMLREKAAAQSRAAQTAGARTGTSAIDSPIRIVSRGGDLTPSFGQEQWWFLEQMQPESVSNIILALYGFSGPLDVEVLRRSVETVINRHEALRTYLPAIDGIPVQRIMPPGRWNLPTTDLRHLQGRELEKETWRLVRDIARYRFDLTRGPLVRTSLLRTADGEYTLAIGFHHNISDGWSVDLFFREMIACYSAYVSGTEPQLPDLPVQYADYAQWHRDWLSGDVLESELAYWRERLGGDLPLFEPHTDHPRPRHRTFEVAAYRTQVDRALLASLRELSRKEGVTLFATLLTAFETMLHRYIGEDDVLVGTFDAGRLRPEIERLIGFFVNMLALRTDFSGDPTFRDVLKRTRDVLLGAYAHAGFPYEKLVQELQPHRDFGDNPILRAFFNKLSVSLDMDVQAGPVRIRLLPTYEYQVEGDGITILASERRDEIDLCFLYATELFDESTVARMAQHYGRILEAVVADAGQRLSALPMLSESDLQTLGTLATGPAGLATAAAGESQPCYRQFEARAAETPGAAGALFAGDTLTYGALNERANRLAHHLRAIGVGAGALVGLSMERSLEMLVGLLAIQKAGGAYVPLDPGFPPERLAFMLADSGARVLVTAGATPGEFVIPDGVRVVDTRQTELGSLPPGNLDVDVSPGDAAYVIYTSGSTGRPKGVVIPHGALANFLMSMRREPGIAPSDVVVAVTTLSFDIAGLELWLPLTSGARVVIASRNDLVDPLRLMVLLANHDATIMQATPATWRQLLEAGWSGSPTLTALCGGEALPRDLADALLPKVRELWNLYGPTETTIWSTVARVTREPGAPHIGRPIANTRVYVVDRHGQQVPAGVPGELWIGGEGVATGYHDRADLTAERFTVDPFAPGHGARVYRTGDRGRWRPDGMLEHLGRLDTQVKLRGFRVELGEIEAVLREHRDVREAVVIVREDTPGDQRLVAYVVTSSDLAPLADEIRRHLKARLPEYMLPGHLVSVPAIPLSPNGKIDRRALPAPAGDAARESTPPRNPTEELVAGVWASVLGRESVGVHESFFDLGGHSLLAARVTARLSDAMGVDLPVRRLFEMQTVAELAAHMLQLQRTPGPVMHPVQRADRTLPLVLSSAQRRLWFFDQLEAGSSAYNIAGIFRFAGRPDVAILQRCLTEILCRHEALRTTFTSLDGQPVQLVEPPVTWGIRTIDLREVAPGIRETEALRLAGDEANRPFDLTASPLARACLITLDDERHLFLVTFHHIAADGLSLDVFVRELAALYAADVAGEPSPLPPLPIQYADFAAWQQEWLAGDIPAADLEYWRDQLKDVAPALELPLDYPRPTAQHFGGGTVARLLPPALRDRLASVSRAENATLFMTLLTTLQVVLGRLSGQSDVCVGIPVAGRARAETQGLIGNFVNTLVVRARLGDHCTFRDQLRQVREATLGAFAHQELPFERIVEDLQPERDLSRTPLYQVMLNMFTYRGPVTLEMPGFSLQLAPPGPEEAVHSKFDLTLYVVDEPDGLRITTVYNVELFSSQRMEALADEFAQLLESIAAGAAVDMMATSLVTPASKQVLPDPAMPIASQWTLPVHERFREHALARPAHHAIVDSDGILTYDALERVTNQLANALIAAGIGREDVVAIHAARNAGFAWAMLGILKAGAAFVMVDPAAPPERLAQSIRLAKPRAWIDVTASAVRPPAVMDQLDAISGLVSFRWAPSSPEDEQAWRAYSLDAPAHTVQADDLAYIVFTSGSTGEPKGIAGTHAPLSHFFAWHAENFGLTHADRFAVLSGLAHDPLLRNVLGAFWAGATICMPESAEFGTPGYLAGWLLDERVSVAHLTPAMAALILEGRHDDSAPLPALRRVFFGGDALTGSIVERVRQLAPGAECANFYGASETPQAIAWQPLPSTEPPPSLVPIGRGIADVQLLIITPSGALAGIGELGEIHVRTPYLARGYVDQPGLTAERFVRNPFRADPSDRMYRTGDLGRYRPDGTVEFAGRGDEQVKIRGYRVELGEVEVALRSLPDVGDAAVIFDAGTSGEPALVAYVTSSGGALSRKELREGMRYRVPDYMMPAHFVILERIPLTPNGKLDRRRLPAPEPEVVAERVEPRTDSERTVANAWSEVLGHARFGVHENFFELGGHSLMATRVFSRLRASLGVELPIRALFEAPTVAQLALRVEESQMLAAAAADREEVSL